MNIETDKTLDRYLQRARKLQRKSRTMTGKGPAGWDRRMIQAELRSRGRPLRRIRLELSNISWSCYADREAIWSLRRDGYTVEDLEPAQEAHKGGTVRREGIRHAKTPLVSLSRLEGHIEAVQAEPWLEAHYRAEYPQVAV